MISVEEVICIFIKYKGCRQGLFTDYGNVFDDYLIYYQKELKRCSLFEPLDKENAVTIHYENGQFFLYFTDERAAVWGNVYRFTKREDATQKYLELYTHIVKQDNYRNIRKANVHDLSRVAEIYVFNNRMNYFPIFNDEKFSFGELQVTTLIDHYFSKEDVLDSIYVLDDGIIRGFIQMEETEICKLYVDPFFQSRGFGNQIIVYAIEEFHVDTVWALEKNTRAISFYQAHGFHCTQNRKFEEGTLEYLVKLKR